jgi:hypothetical protein
MRMQQGLWVSKCHEVELAASTPMDVGVAGRGERFSPDVEEWSRRSRRGGESFKVRKVQGGADVKLWVSVDQKVREVGRTGAFTSWAASCLGDSQSV